MIRDWDLIRLVLLDIASENGGEWTLSTEAGYDLRAINQHVQILEDGELITDVIRADDGIPFSTLARLTWEGHEFINTIRDEGVWVKTKAKISGVSSVAFDLVKSIAANFASGELGIN